jgi:hypothetical protein
MRRGVATVSNNHYGGASPEIASSVRVRERLGLPSLSAFLAPDDEVTRPGSSTVAVSTSALRIRLGLSPAAL